MLTINLADPSGSSAAEKPPAKKIMLAFSMLGDVSITVPKDFDGIYTLHTNNTGEVLKVPTTNQTSNSVIEVDGYSKISVEKGENNG